MKIVLHFVLQDALKDRILRGKNQLRSSIEDAEKSYISTKKEESLYINDSSFGTSGDIGFTQKSQ